MLNNAGVINKNAPIWKVSYAEFKKVLDINVNGVALLMQQFLPLMIEKCKKNQSKGFVVNFSSGWGRSTSPEVAPYCASKWAVEGLSKAVSQELEGSGVSCIALNPGIINTKMLQSCWSEGALSYPGPENWVKGAVKQICNFSPSDNGKSLSIN